MPYVLDPSRLPPSLTPEAVALAQLPSFRERFGDTVVKCLTNLEDALKDMLSQSAQAVSVFLPKETMKPEAEGGKKKVRDYPMTEMEAIYFLLLESLRLTRDITPQAQAQFYRTTMNYFDEIEGRLKTLREEVEGHRKELKMHMRRFSLMYGVCKFDYPKAIPPAAELFSDFYISTEYSAEISKPYGVQETPKHKLMFRCQPNGYAVYTRLPECTPNWRDGITFDPSMKKVMTCGIAEEFNARINRATRVLKASLSKIMRTGTSSLEDCEGERTGLRLEIDKLYRLFQFRRLALNRADSTTIIFLFMRTDHNIRLLNKKLYSLVESIKVMESRIKYLGRNCGSWKAVGKKLISGPVSFVTEMKNYALLEIPLLKYWTDECVR
jgi:hypothetical protein